MLLLTGASGFIGKHLLPLLIEKYGKNNIVALTSKPISECPFLLHDNYQFEQDFFTKSEFQDIDTIIHAGAYTPKKGSESNEIDLSNSNIYNTQKLLNSTLPSLRKFVFLSTLDVYDNEDIISESTLENPISLYGYSKLYCEKMIEVWGKKHNKAIQILRIGHVYGPGEEVYQKVIPVTFKKVLKNESPQIWGTGNELRSFIYIKDVAKAVANSINLKENIGVVNLVSGQAISINEIANKIIKISKIDVKTEKIHANSIGRDLVFDNSKMRQWLLDKETDIDIGLYEEYEYLKTLIID